jgi:hypothetical protein
VSRSLGDAWVSVGAQDNDFGGQVSRIVKAGTAGLKADIPVTVNDLSAKINFESLKKARDDLAGKVATIKVDVNDKASQATLLTLKARIDKLNSTKIDPKADLTDLTRMSATVLRLDGQLDKLAGAGADAGGKLVKTLGDTGSEAGESLLEKLSGVLSSPPVALTALGLGLASLPLIAQTAGLGIVAGLGAGLAGIAIYAASKSADVRQTFLTLKQNANHDLSQIGAPFIPVMESIYSTATGVLNKLTPIFTGATGAIAGPFKTFADALLKAFGSPAVQTAIANVAASFGQLLTAATPALAGAVTNIASGITKLSQAIAQNPGILRDFISDLGMIVGAALTAIAGMTEAAAAIEKFADRIDDAGGDVDKFLTSAGKPISDFFTKTIPNDAKAAADAFQNDFVTPAKNVLGNLVQWLGPDFADKIADFFTKTIPADFKAAVASAKSDFITPIESDFNAAVAWINTNLVGKITTFFTKTIPTDFKAAVTSAKSDLISPIETAFTAAVSWISTNLVGKITTFFGTTIPNDFKAAVTSARNDFVTPIENAFSGAWTWITGHFITPIHTFLTSTLPADFRSAVSAVGSAWTGVENAVETPVKFVVNDVIDKLISAFDTVSKAVGGPSIPQVTFAGGGQVPGTGTGDTVRAMLTPGEVVVPVGMVRAGAVDHLRGMLPGFASGGVVPGGGQSVHTGTTAVPTGDPLTGVLGKAADALKLVADLATGDTAASINAFMSLIGTGTGGAVGDLATLLVDVPATLVKSAVSFLSGLASKAAAATGGAAGGKNVAGGPGGSNAANQALGQKMAAEFGWTGAQWSDLNQLVMDESGWSSTIVNPTSTASGIAQNIAGFSASYQSGNATQQINWLLNYISGRYGTPAAALAHENADHWYALGGRVFDNGGTLAPGWNPVYNGTGAAEQLANVTSHGGPAHATTPGHAAPMSADTAALLDELRGIRSALGQQGGQFASALNGAAGGAALRGTYSTRRG